MPKLNSYTVKGSPVDADLIPITDSADGNQTKNVQLSVVKTYVLSAPSITGLASLKSVGLNSESLELIQSAGTNQIATLSEDGGDGSILNLFKSGSNDVRIRSSGYSWMNGGRVGFGTTSPQQDVVVHDAAGTPVLQLTNATSGVASGDGGQLALSGSDLLVSNKEAGVLRFDTNSIERFRLNGNDFLAGMGGVSPTFITPNGVGLHIHDPAGDDGAGIHMTTNATGATGTDGSSIFHAGTDLRIDNREAGAIIFRTNAGSDVGRFDSVGAFTVGNTVHDSGNASCGFGATGLMYATRDSNHCAIFNRLTNDGDLVQFRQNNTIHGTISISGSTTSYNTTSDYRLKENVIDLTGALDRVKLLPVHRFNFLSTPDKTVDGFLAHEVTSVVPEAVTGEKDAERDEEFVETPALGNVVKIARFENQVTQAAVEEQLNEKGEVVVAAQDEVREMVEVEPETVLESDVEKPDSLAEGTTWVETSPAVIATRTVPVYQSIDQSKLVPLLVASVQEIEARLTALEA